jgi:chloride channel 3/4/5
MNNGASSSSSSSASHPSALRPPNGNGNPYDTSPYAPDDPDDLDLLGDDDPHHRASHNTDADDDTAAILDADPLQTDLSSPLTFKRKQKQPSRLLSHPARLFTALTGRTFNTPTPQPQQQQQQQQHQQHNPHDPPPPGGGATETGPSTSHPLQETQPPPPNKDAHDWYTEGPGRRVGYEDLTAIDWIFEYTKERQRQRRLLRSHAQHPLLGSLQRLLDASQVWVVLILSGLVVGVLAAGIDVASDWLGDVKYGFCSAAVDGGRFYLGRTACCLGYDEGSQCTGWKSWGEVFGLGGGGAGRWVAEGAVYVVLAVGFCF